jgi:L-ascorbate metabolism protein UlaG (beta-lactamase superfamily)
MALKTDATFTWLGHATWLVKTPGGKSLLIDPWVMQNPACPDDRKSFDGVDAMLITHGHFDHIADAVEIGKKHRPKTVCIFETSVWLQGKGLAEDQLVGMNKGGTVEVLDGVRATMVSADHSCGILDDDGSIVYGGDPCGYVVELEDGFRFYHAGDTNVFGDMRLIGELYRPDIAFLPIDGHFNMGPREAARAVELLGVDTVVPMHYGTFPILTGTPGALRELVPSGITVLETEPGGQL